jgi:hypothetical protein
MPEPSKDPKTTLATLEDGGKETLQRSDTHAFRQAVHEVETSLRAIPEPASLHEGTAYICLGRMPIARNANRVTAYRVAFVLGSFGLLFLQVFASASLVRNIDNVGKVCSTSDECRYGFFCGASTGRCDPCKWPAEPVRQQSGGKASSTDFCGDNGALLWTLAYRKKIDPPSDDVRLSQCDGCYSATGKYLRSWSAPYQFYNVMEWADHIMLILATSVIAFAFMDEMVKKPLPVYYTSSSSSSSSAFPTTVPTVLCLPRPGLHAAARHQERRIPRARRAERHLVQRLPPAAHAASHRHPPIRLPAAAAVCEPALHPPDRL